MKNISGYKNKILFAIFALFLFLYILSFIPVFSREGYKNRKNSMETALLNPDKVSELCEINFGRGEEFISLKKMNIRQLSGSELTGKDLAGLPSKEDNILGKDKEIWFGKSSFMDDYFIADQEEIENITDKLKKIIRLYKISDNSSKEQAYGLENNQRLWVNYKISDRETQFFIGNLDSASSSYYISFLDKKGIWKCQAHLKELTKLNLSPLISPLVIPQADNFEIEVINFKENGKVQKHIIPSEKEEFKKLLSLRHGPLISDQNILSLILENKEQKAGTENLSIKIQYSDNFSLTLTFFEFNENSFLLNTDGKNINYTSSISRWTYENLLELLKTI